MGITYETISVVRRLVFGITGLTCLIYALAALVLNRPDPMNPFIPGSLGVLAAIAITATALMAGRQAAGRAADEGYLADSRLAAQRAYWIALLLYLVMAVPLARDWIEHTTAYAAMGTLTGASYLLIFVYQDLRGRS